MTPTADDQTLAELGHALTGCLLGTAVGDSLGLPREGLSAERAARLYGREIRHCLVLGRGLVSDDTEHAAFTVLVLVHGLYRVARR